MSDPSTIDDLKTAAAAGGSFGGAFFALRWLVNWVTRRLDRRQERLDAEHDALDMGWKEYRLHTEKRLASVEKQNRALHLAFQHVSAALIRAEPQNPALAIAERIMATAFPDDFSLSAAMAAGAIDRTEATDHSTGKGHQ
jgi:hypothetical protein